MIEQRREPRVPVNCTGLANHDNILTLINVKDKSEHGIGFDANTNITLDVGEEVEVKYNDKTYLVKIVRELEKDKGYNFGGIIEKQIY